MHSPSLAIQTTDLTKIYNIWPDPKTRLRHALQEMLPLRKAATTQPKPYKSFYALKGLTLEIKAGESVGIVGRNGSGKSTLLQLITGILQPTSGSVRAQGRIAALLELGSGFNPDFTGKENVFFSAALLGFSREQITASYDAITKFANIGEFINQPVKNYSSGMRLRLAFSVYTMVAPDILIVDEALSVGDEGFQRKCFRRLETLREAGTTLLFVSHSPSSIIQLCDRAIWLEQGELVYDGAPKETMAAYHRFSHLPADKRVAFIKEKQLPDSPTTTPTSPAEPESAPEELPAQMDPSLIPQSLDEYPSRGATIQNFRIRDSNGRTVNILKRNDHYTFEYDVHFNETCHGVFFAMFIKALNGVELGGATTPPTSKRIDYILAGTTKHISFSFKCLLNYDVYFINAGVEKIEDENSVFAHRIVDSAMFRVIPETDTHATGIIDFQVEATVNIPPHARAQ